MKCRVGQAEPLVEKERREEKDQVLETELELGGEKKIGVWATKRSNWEGMQ